MGNPFIDSKYMAAGAASAYAPYSTQKVGGVDGGRTPQVGGAELGFSGGAAIPSALREVSEVGVIGAEKKDGFENGLGGTNNPDNHKIFYAA